MGVPDSVVALVTYGLVQVNDRVDAVVRRFYSTVLRTYWPRERKFVEDGYSSLSFPFDELQAPDLEMSAEWTLAEFAGYIASWSGVRALVDAEGGESFEMFLRVLSKVWDAPARKRPVRWPISMRVGRIHPKG